MRISQLMLRVSLVALFCAPVATSASAQTTAVTPGSLRSYSTIASIGVEWDLTGDANHDATATLEYRKAGTSTWKATLPMIRMDYNGSNMLSGSILFLAADTSYDVRIVLTDPDGGGATRQVPVRTRAVPIVPVAGRILHVVPGAGGGDGSAGSPFGGVAAAESVALPGDTFLVHAGNYGGRIRFLKAGTASSKIVWKAAGDGEVLMNGIDVTASDVWLEGLSIKNQKYGLLSYNSPARVVITRCTFSNNHYGMYLPGAGADWYIADNTIVGDTPATSGSLDGEGIDLNITSGHTVAHNRISNVADGISYPSTNVDIVGNDIFDTSDDGIEADNGRANVRIWGNRIHNAVHNGISFQPQLGGPWYIVRNQIVGNAEAAFKFRTTDRFVLLHNTIVNWGTAWPGTSMMCCNEDHLLRAYSRNNLWVSVQGGQIWGFDAGTRDWRTDLDYDGFDWGTASDPFAYGGVTYDNLLSFSNASGLEANGVRVWRSSCFEQFDVPGPAPASIPPQVMTLQAGCPAVDAGAPLPGVNDGFAGRAPDLGAHEYGQPLPDYGPRPAPSPPQAPTALAAQAVSSTRVDLRWSDNATSESGFRIERSAGGGPFTITAIVAANVVSYGDTTVSAANSYAYRVAAYNAAGLSAYSNVASVVTPGVGSTPYGGTAVALPGTVQAENFDEGGPGVAYTDTTTTNSGGQYRTTRVDIGTTTDSGGGYYVGWTRPGEWLQYSVAVAGAGTYTLDLRVANLGTGARLHVEIDGVNRTNSISVPNTGGWQTWQTLTRPGLSLTAGPHVVRLVFETGTLENGGVGNYNWLRFVVATGADVLLYPGKASVRRGTWEILTDASAAGGIRMHQPDAGVPKVAAPLASPANYFEMSFSAQAGIPYHMWFRAKADNNSYSNDSVWVQFSNSVDGTGTPAWRIGSAGGFWIGLEECSGCGVQGWGWHDNAYGTGVRGAPIYFTTTGVQTIRIQQREDGISIDQLLLSPSTYLIASPGATKNDTVILPEAGGAGGGGGGGTIDEIVIHANTVSTVTGAWAKETDTTAADTVRLRNPDAGVPKLTTASASPGSYFEKTFNVDAGKPYHLWVRMKADNNSYSNDSVFVQFSGAQTGTGTASWRIGTTSALAVSLEDTNGAGVQGWGWNDNAYGSLGAPIYFAAGGSQTIRVQVREDGMSIDQIVLSASKYLDSSPGSLKNDTTILPATVP